MKKIAFILSLLAMMLYATTGQAEEGAAEERGSNP